MLQIFSQTFLCREQLTIFLQNIYLIIIVYHSTPTNKNNKIIQTLRMVIISIKEEVIVRKGSGQQLLIVQKGSGQ